MASRVETLLAMLVKGVTSPYPKVVIVMKL
jgi:hypothetical protein